MRNIELKARLLNAAAAEDICRSLTATFQRDIHQVDTYFRVPAGRLKLRENDPGEAELIYYHRADQPDSKGSEYSIAPGSEALRKMLSEALGIIVTVRKVRSLWLWSNVRIHLDTVDGLGRFIEFEAVLSDEYDDADGHTKLATLREAFGIVDGDLLAQSYSDMLIASAR